MLADMSRSRLSSLGLALAVLVALTASCTSGDDSGSGTHDAVDAPTSTAPAVSLTRPNAPLEVSIAQLRGGVRRSERARLVRAISRPIATWVNGSFLEGEYPRAGFSAGFRSWTLRAASLAIRDRQFTTNAALGGDVVAVVADEQRARLFVFASHGLTGGATAAVRLRLTEQRQDAVLAHVRVTGELYLTRKGNTWRIFGYDLNRSVAQR